MIHTMLSIMFNSGEKVEIEGRSELGLFSICLFYLELYVYFIFIGLGLPFLRNNSPNIKKYKNSTIHSHIKPPMRKCKHFFICFRKC